VFPNRTFLSGIPFILLSPPLFNHYDQNIVFISITLFMKKYYQFTIVFVPDDTMLIDKRSRLTSPTLHIEDVSGVRYVSVSDTNMTPTYVGYIQLHHFSNFYRRLCVNFVSVS
jgi:hypothetical protein